jgi:hypothetical protein
MVESFNETFNLKAICKWLNKKDRMKNKNFSDDRIFYIRAGNID